MAQDAATYYRNIISGYGATISFSDFKANVAIVFVAIMMGPVVGFRDKFPSYLPFAVIILPFFVVFFCLLCCLFPRYPRAGQEGFPVVPNGHPLQFLPPENDDIHIRRQQAVCAVFSNILFWKTLMLRISFYVCIGSVVAISALIAYNSIREAFVPAEPAAVNQTK